MSSTTSTDRGLFLFGLPRSGTTWLGKIFDSHPDTLFLHEPDTVHPTTEFPFIVPSEEIAQHQAAARRYLLDRMADRELRCVAGTPYFDKAYRSGAAEKLRRAMMFAARGLDSATRGRLERRFKVPDFARAGGTAIPVLKSVDSTARLPLFATACPESRFVFIVRNPCGVLGSRIRGRKLGKLGQGKAYLDWLKLDEARRRGLTLSDLEGWDSLASATWGWILFNDSVLRACEQLPNVYVLNYDAFCDNPLVQCRELFDHCGLPWSTQTEDYINACLTVDPTAKKGYYSTVQNPATAANRWRTELEGADIAAVAKLCGDSVAAQPYLPLMQSA